MTRKTHQNFRNKSDQGKLIQAETVLSALWTTQGFGGLDIRHQKRSPSFESRELITCRIRETLALPWNYSPVQFSALQNCESQLPDATDNLTLIRFPNSARTPCYFSLSCHTQHYPYPTLHFTHVQFLEQYNSIHLPYIVCVTIVRSFTSTYVTSPTLKCYFCF